MIGQRGKARVFARHSVFNLGFQVCNPPLNHTIEWNVAWNDNPRFVEGVFGSFIKFYYYNQPQPKDMMKFDLPHKYEAPNQQHGPR